MSSCKHMLRFTVTYRLNLDAAKLCCWIWGEHPRHRHLASVRAQESPVPACWRECRVPQSVQAVYLDSSSLARFEHKQPCAHVFVSTCSTPGSSQKLC